MSLPLDPERVLGALARARRDEIAYYLASIVESSDDAILTINLDGIITSWNTGAERLYGYTAEEAIGKPMLASNPAQAWHLLRLGNVADRLPQWGRLFAM